MASELHIQLTTKDKMSLLSTTQTHMLPATKLTIKNIESCCKCKNAESTIMNIMVTGCSNRS